MIASVNALVEFPINGHYQRLTVHRFSNRRCIEVKKALQSEG